MNRPPPIKNPAAPASATGKPKGKTYSYKSADYHAAVSWSIPPDDRDGFEVTIGNRGHVLLTQDRPFTVKAVIVLHPVEASTLLGILPDAIIAADKHRKEAA
jgi:hypothetical protein